MDARNGDPARKALSSPLSFGISVIRAFAERGALVDAGAMAFSLFLASIPLMGLFGTVIAHLLSGNPRGLAMVSALFRLAPAEVQMLVNRQFSRGSSHPLAPVFLFGSLYLAAGAFHDAMTVFEGALGAQKRSWFEKRAIGLACVIAFVVLVSALGFAVVSLAGGLFTVSSLFRKARGVLSVVPILAVTGAWLLIAGFFRVAVRRAPHHVAVWPGATVTVCIGCGASVTFAFYARSLANYAAFYGSLAAVAVFLVWLWICCIALLLGVETNALLDRTRHPDVAMPASRR